MTYRKNNTNFNSDNFKDSKSNSNKKLQLFNITKDKNNRKIINLDIVDNGGNPASLDFFIDRQAAKSLVDILNKEFELDEVYKSMYRKNYNFMDINRRIESEIELIDTIIYVEGLEYWGDLLNIRAFFRILHKYESNDKSLDNDKCVEVLNYFKNTFYYYWLEKMKTPEDKFLYFLLCFTSLEGRLSDYQIDNCMTIVSKIIKNENYSNFNIMLKDLDNLERKYKSFLKRRENDEEKNNTLFTLKQLRRYKIKKELENKYLRAEKKLLCKHNNFD